MRMITHSYDTYDHAVAVVQQLEAAGVPHDDISLVSGDKDRTIATTTSGDTAEGTATGAGTGASLGTLIGGGAGLLAGLGMMAIPGVGPVVAAGWLIATLTGAGVGAAAGGLLGSLTGAGVDAADAQGYVDHVGRGGTLVTVRASDEMAPRVEQILDGGRMTTGMATAAPAMATAPLVAAPVAPVVAPAARTAAVTGDDKLQVIQENLVVGKRAVEAGGVSITSRVVETPVSEQVTLHEERVTIDRRPVNRPLSGVAADAFRERTLSATSRSEEAVVGKEARVVEEIGLSKSATERVETVRDTVRETKVDVVEVPATVTTTNTTVTGTTGVGTGVGTGTTGVGTGPSSVRDNAATRGIDGALGTNVSGENPKR